MSAYKNERGTWNVKFYYTDWTGKRKQKKKEGFATKKEAQTFEADFLNKCKTSVDITFANLVKNYMEDCRVHLKPTTLANKEHRYPSRKRNPSLFEVRSDRDRSKDLSGWI